MSTELELVDTPAPLSTELVVSAQEAAAIKEIEGAIIVAQRFPRDEHAGWQALMKTCKSPSFAATATYRFPRGGKDVSGPSVHLARACARAYGNFRFGVIILSDDEENRSIRAWAWDVQTNSYTSADDTFKKKIQRKNYKSGTTEWVVPDERDLRELTNRRAAILKRNVIFEMIPRHYIDDALTACGETLRDEGRKDPESLRKRVIYRFGELNIAVAKLNVYLGVPIKDATPDQLADLWEIAQSIRDGNSKWEDYAPDAKEEPKGPVNINDLMDPKDGTTAEDTRRREKGGKAKAAPKEEPPPAGTPAVGAGADDMFSQGEIPMPSRDELQEQMVRLLAELKLTEATIKKQLGRWKATDPGDLSTEALTEYVVMLERIKANEQKGSDA